METQSLDARHFDERFGQVCRAMGRRLGVVPDIHPQDYVFRFSFDDPERSDKASAVVEYFRGGREAAEHLNGTIKAHRRLTGPFSLLEFAAGYGRVSRHLQQVIPSARILSCDIHAEAVEFLRRIGCEAAPSCTVPEEFQTGRKFDVVYALSFFSHVPKRTWGRWLSALAGQLLPGGLLIFTTHGEAALETLGAAALGSDGFWFTEFSEQKDLGTRDYGASATSFDFVYRHIAANDLRLLRYSDAGMGYQDLYVLAARASEAMH